MNYNKDRCLKHIEYESINNPASRFYLPRDQLLKDLELPADPKPPKAVLKALTPKKEEDDDDESEEDVEEEAPEEDEEEDSLDLEPEVTVEPPPNLDWTSMLYHTRRPSPKNMWSTQPLHLAECVIPMVAPLFWRHTKSVDCFVEGPKFVLGDKAPAHPNGRWLDNDQLVFRHWTCHPWRSFSGPVC